MNCKVKYLNWKKKATTRNREIIELNKRIKELERSRDQWKGKYFESRNQSETSNDSEKLFGKAKPYNHHYQKNLIGLCVNSLSYSGCSLRTAQFFIEQLYLHLGIISKIPSHTSIRTWASKLGYNQLFNPPPPEGKWVLIVDESINIGKNRVLLVLGIRQDKWHFANALRSKDVVPLYFGIDSQWNGEKISPILKEIQKKYDTLYVVSDRGSNLLNAYKKSDLEAVSDCTHALAGALKKYCDKEKLISELISKSGKLRPQWILSKNACYLPPVSRKKSRFHNLEPLSKWAKSILRIKNIPKQVKDKLSFIFKHKKKIHELEWINKFIKKTNKIIKCQGYSAKVHRKIMKKISFCRTKKRPGNHALTFLANIENYLLNLSKQKHLGKKIICCSDIIETTFGRLKYGCNANSSFGMTEFTVARLVLRKNFSTQTVVHALESVKEMTLKKWRKGDFPKSLFQERALKFNQKWGEENSTN